MAFLKQNEEVKFKDSTCDGDKENPKIIWLHKHYKLALYLGYNIKWDYDYIFISDKKYLYSLKPVFKKSYDSFDFWWYKTNWIPMMEILLPKLEKDGLFNDKLKSLLVELNFEGLFNEIMVIVNNKIPDKENIFKKTVEY